MLINHRAEMCHYVNRIVPFLQAVIEPTLQEAGFLFPLLTTVSESSGGPCTILECSINKKEGKREMGTCKNKGIEGSNNKLETARRLKERASES